VQDVARWLNIMPPLLMELSHATFTNITEQGLWHVIYSLSPWFIRDEQEFTLKLFSKEERETYTVKYNPDALVRGDIEKRMKAHVQALTNGIRNIDEVRELEDLNPLPDGLGQEYRVQAQMTTLGEEPEESQPPPALPPMLPGQNDEEPDQEEEAQAGLRRQIAEAYVPALADPIERMMRIAYKSYQRIPQDREARSKWYEEFVPDHAIKYRGAIIPAMMALGGAMRAMLGRAVLTDAWEKFEMNFVIKATEQYKQTLCQDLGSLGDDVHHIATLDAQRLIDNFVAQATEPNRWDFSKN
jgi:hypothetical protein